MKRITEMNKANNQGPHYKALAMRSISITHPAEFSPRPEVNSMKCPSVSWKRKLELQQYICFIGRPLPHITPQSCSEFNKGTYSLEFHRRTPDINVYFYVLRGQRQPHCVISVNRPRLRCEICYWMQWIESWRQGLTCLYIYKIRNSLCAFLFSESEWCLMNKRDISRKVEKLKMTFARVWSLCRLQMQMTLIIHAIKMLSDLEMFISLFESTVLDSVTEAYYNNSRSLWDTAAHKHGDSVRIIKVCRPVKSDPIWAICVTVIVFIGRGPRHCGNYILLQSASLYIWFMYFGSSWQINKKNCYIKR